MIVAISEDNAIGKNGDLLCHLSADLKHFKKLTMGGTIIMGRKTFESLPNGALPGRRNVVVSRNKDYNAVGAEVADSVEAALKATSNDEKRFVIGGAHLYEAMIGCSDILYLTRIHHKFPDADTYFPLIDWNEWQEMGIEFHEADEKNKYSFSFIELRRK